MHDYATAVRLLAVEIVGGQDEIEASPLLDATALLWGVDRLKVLFDVLGEKRDHDRSKDGHRQDPH